MSAETLQFKTELKQLLHLIVHSLYSHPEIFLRELISNASDAIDTIRFEGLTKPELVEGNEDWKIKLIPDREKGTLNISDNGVGMSPEIIVENLGTIARSGTKAFLEALRQAEAKDRPELIGQFGVGFYSSFMVADRVTVISRMAGPVSAGVRWESDGQGEFTVERVDKATRGTDVILHLKEEAREYLEPWKLRRVVKQYSDFIAHAIVLDVEREKDGQKVTEEETLNARKAIWLRPRTEVTEEEYNEFYKHLAHDIDNPARVIHYNAEGLIEFRALLYLPAHKTWDMMWGDSKKGLQLYIQRVFIMDDCEALLPRYLRFVRGVVDSPDLPLNVSREILQQSAPLEKIKSNLTTKILNTLDEMRRKEYDRYVGFYKELGPIFKEGISQDFSNRDKIADLLLFESTRTEPGKFTSLAEYVERMPADQSEIWFMSGESREWIEHAPAIEGLKAHGQEVLLLTDPIDDFVISWMPEYKGKQLKAADKGVAGKDEIDEAKKGQYKDLLAYLQSKVPEVKDVRLSSRLKESAACLVSEEGDVGAHMERVLRRMGRGDELPTTKRVLEINPDHPAVQAVQQLYTKDPNHPDLEQYCRLLYEQALIGEGSKVPDFSAFARRVNELLTRAARRDMS
jgi:molecular chaperone HtpG